ncbi:hypothetical protein Tco_1210762 [Tanacetum coccineum]
MQETCEKRSLAMTHKLDDMIQLPKSQPKKAYKKGLSLIPSSHREVKTPRGLICHRYGKNPVTPLLMGRRFLETASTVIDCKKSKIVVGEGVTRSIFRVKEINLGDDDVPYWTFLGKRESYKPRPSTDSIGARPPYHVKKGFIDYHLPEEWKLLEMLKVYPTDCLSSVSGIARPKIDKKARFELKGQFLKELHDNNFSGSDNEDENEHTKKEVILFYTGLDIPTRQILDSKGDFPSMKAVDAKKANKDMDDHSQKWHNGTSTRSRSTDTSDGLAAIQAQPNNLGRD